MIDSCKELKEALEHWGVSEAQYMSDEDFGVEIEGYYTSGYSYQDSVYKALYKSLVVNPDALES